MFARLAIKENGKRLAGPSQEPGERLPKEAVSSRLRNSDIILGGLGLRKMKVNRYHKRTAGSERGNPRNRTGDAS